MRKLITVIILLTCCLRLPAEEFNVSKAYQDELWFPVGETISYRISTGAICGWGTTVTTSEWIEEDGKTYLRIQMRTKSNGVLKALYPVDDLMESIIDPVTFLPIRFTKKLKEGKYRCNEVTTFDHANQEAQWKSLLRDEEKEYPIDEDTRDLISFMYYMRALGVQPGTKGEYRVMADEKIYDLFVQAGREEKLKLRNYGKVKVVRMDPEAAFDGLFVRKGKMQLWVSNDERMLCTQIKAKVPVASVRIVLDKVSGPGTDRWVKSSKSD